MELICPSCEARYGVPADAIGPQGRQVSCTNCGHGWRATPPLELTSAMATAGAGTQPARGAEAGRGMAEVYALRATEPSRHAQLAEIRDMIAQVQSDNGAADARETTVVPGAVPAAPAAPAATPIRAAAPAAVEAPARSELRRIDDIEEGGGEAALHQDPLRRRMAELDARATRERSERNEVRRSAHRRDEERSGSGAFLTGFLLVLLIGAALLAAYLMRPQIVQRFPESEAMLRDYGDTVDGARRGIADGYERGRDWVIRTAGGEG